MAPEGTSSGRSSTAAAALPTPGCFHNRYASKSASAMEAVSSTAVSEAVFCSACWKEGFPHT